jgi:hypothetical protein
MPIPIKRHKGMKKIFIGIDFSKEKFDATVINGMDPKLLKEEMLAVYERVKG